MRHVPRRLYLALQPALRWPAFGHLLCDSKATKSRYVQRWRDLDGDPALMAQELPTSGDFWLSQYTELVNRWEANDPELLAAGDAARLHLERMQEILSESP